MGEAQIRILDDLVYLDVAESFAVSSSTSAWVEAGVNSSLRAEANFFFAMTSIPGNDTFIINGGVGSMNESLLVNPTIVYNARTETWTSVSASGGLQTLVAIRLKRKFTSAILTLSLATYTP